MGMILRDKDGNPVFWPDTPELIVMPKRSMWTKIQLWIRQIFGVPTITFVNGSKIVISRKLKPVRGSVKVYTMDDDGRIGPAFQLDSDPFTTQ